MKPGDIVSLPTGCLEKTGIILDTMEMTDGFLMVEVLHGSEVDWFDEIEVKQAKKQQKKGE